MMNNRLITTVVCAFCLISISSADAGPQRVLPPPPLPTISQESIQSYIRDLSDPDFEIREQASTILENCGSDVIPELGLCLQDPEREVRTRALNLLQKILVKALVMQMDSDVDQVEQCINDALESDVPQVRDWASQLLDSYSVNSWFDLELYDLGHIWERFVIRRIVSNGGLVIPNYSSPGTRYDPDTEGGSYDVVIGRKWHGEEHLLKFIPRLPALKRVYVLNGSKISQEIIDTLNIVLPEPIEHRSAAKLGVMSQNTGPGIASLELKDVVPGSAAAKAGMQVHDIIIAFEGQPLENFRNLIETIKSHEPGDHVKITILRNTKKYDLDVELDGWDPDSDPAIPR
jgi:hypothetical protein